MYFNIKIISASKIEMQTATMKLPVNMFFKKPEGARTMEYTMADRLRDATMNGITNSGARRLDGNHRFGFQTMLPVARTILPTAPPIVGGNADWTISKVTPTTMKLYDALNVGRPMHPAPALGSVLKLSEPNINSIHTTI